MHRSTDPMRDLEIEAHAELADRNWAARASARRTVAFADRAVRRELFANWITTLTDETVAEYGSQRFSACDLVTRKQRIHPLFV
jgi:hypothetical protein